MDVSRLNEAMSVRDEFHVLVAEEAFPPRTSTTVIWQNWKLKVRHTSRCVFIAMIPWVQRTVTERIMSRASNAGTISHEVNIVLNVRDVITTRRGVVEVANFPHATGVGKYQPQSNNLVIVASFARGRHVLAVDRDREVQSIVRKQERPYGNAVFAELHHKSHLLARPSTCAGFILYLQTDLRAY